ncbi:unnamed protein product [Cuscuta epithymum]|uniref:YacP-like NYN domain protein n=3 Tax=Cuscuta epithymum TaxID=186058 RepID=A0AAV0FW78_9ASTE|nr:unnamed protein product [Cuscuta epithymum]
MKGISSIAAIPSSSIFLLRLIGCPDGSRCSYRYSKIAAKKSNNKHQRQKGSEPPRITSNVQQSMRYLRLLKEIERRRSKTAKPATSYRKKREEKEKLPEDTELYRDPTLSLYFTNQVLGTAIPVLLVDGYNVCGFWPKLKKHFMNGRLDIARQKLIDELVTFNLIREVKVVVVFDAMMSQMPVHKESFAGVDVVYSTKTCADAWIEKEVEALREDGCPKVWVATSDQIEQHAAYGAGAFIWSCKALISEIKGAQEELERMLQEHRSTSMQGKLLKHNLDSDVVNALKDLRDKLSGQDSRL